MRINKPPIKIQCAYDRRLLSLLTALAHLPKEMLFEPSPRGFCVWHRRFVFSVSDRDHLAANNIYNSLFSGNDRLICIRFVRFKGARGVGLRWPIEGNSAEATSISLSRSLRESIAARISIGECGELIRWTRDRVTVSTCQWHSSAVVAHPRRRFTRSGASGRRFCFGCFYGCNYFV